MITLARGQSPPIGEKGESLMVFVIDTNKKPLAPCHPAKARKLLNTGKAAVWRVAPFTIILKKAVGSGAPADARLKGVGLAFVTPPAK